MAGSNGDAFNHLDQYWDDTLRGDAEGVPDLDPGLASAVRRLHALSDAIVPDTVFARRLWTDLKVGTANTVNRGPLAVPRAFPLVKPSRGEESAGPIAETRIPPIVGMTGVGGRSGGGRFQFPWTGWQRGVATFVTLTVVVLSLAAGYAAYRLQPPASNPRLSVVSDPGSEALYAYVFDESAETATEPGRWEITPLYPMTLADNDPDGAATFQPPAWAGTLSEQWSTHLWALSADGSTYVAVETWAYVNGVQAKKATIGVYDAQSGAVRSRFDLPSAVYDIRLSRDGSRLVVEAHQSTTQVRDVGTQDPPAWYVVHTADGRIITELPSDEQNGWHDASWIDPEARRLYRLFIPFSRENTGPGATRIVANNLTTGEEIGRLDLPEVQSGVWWTDRTHTVTGGVEYPVIAEMRPGVALSPDGKTLALVHANTDVVTLVDAERLVVERTKQLSRPTGWRDRLLGLLPMVSGDASAKGAQEGIDRHAVFAPDGRHLYVFGSETTFDDEGNAKGRSFGLRRIDLEEAEIVAEATDRDIADGRFSHVVPSPNGRDLYLSGVFSDGESSSIPPSRLWRLDASTLKVQAKRDFPSTLSVVTSPAVPDGRGQMSPGAG